MRKSIIALGVVSILLYGLILVVAPDINTAIAIVAILVAALPSISIIITKNKTHHLEQRFRWFNPIPMYVAFMILPAVFTILLLSQGKLSIPLIIVMVSLACSFFYAFFNMPLAIYHKRKEVELAKKPLNHFPPISVLIPAYNEEKCIAGTIETILDAYYPLKEIIVIDDGSSDNTHQIAQSYATKNKNIKVIHRRKGGKGAALNHGLQFAQGEIIVRVDADCMVTRETLVELVKRFDDPTVAAVAGHIKVLNRNKFITALQALEYIADINVSRKGLDLFGGVIVVPGCLEAFRTKDLKTTGGWDIETAAEDLDTTIKVFKRGAFNSTAKKNKVSTVHLEKPDSTITIKSSKIVRGIQVSSTAIAYTEAPERVGDLWRQRLRWYRGNFQAMQKHRDALLNSKFRALSKLSFPYIMISMVFIPIGMLAVIATSIIAILRGEVIPLLAIVGLFVLLQVLVSMFAIELDEEDMKLALYSPLNVLGYKHFLDVIKMKAFFDVFTKKKMVRDKPHRLGLYQKELAKKELTGRQQKNHLYLA